MTTKSIKHYRTVFAVAAASVLTLAVASCGAGDADENGAVDAGSNGSNDAGGETYEMIVGATSAGSSLEVEALERWSEAVAERTNQQLTITVLPDGQLGNELEIQEAILTGDVHGVSGGVTGVPEWDFLAAAYIFRDAEHMMGVIRSDVVEPWREAWREQSGIEVVGVLERLPRTLTSNVRVESPDDTVGLDVRVPSTDFQIAIWEAVGATPTAISPQEVYSALETGTVDAQENALDTAYATGIDEVQDYVILTEHTFMPQLVGVSTAFLDSLPEGFAEIVHEEMTVAEDWLSQEMSVAYADILADLESKGLEVIEPDTEAFRSAMYPVTERFAAEIWGGDLLERIVEDF